MVLLKRPVQLLLKHDYKIDKMERTTRLKNKQMFLSMEDLLDVYAYCNGITYIQLRWKNSCKTLANRSGSHKTSLYFWSGVCSTGPGGNALETPQRESTGITLISRTFPLWHGCLVWRNAAEAVLWTLGHIWLTSTKVNFPQSSAAYRLCVPGQGWSRSCSPSFFISLKAEFGDTDFDVEMFIWSVITNMNM